MPRSHLDEAVGGWCPSCRSAYRPGFERCADCDVELVDELPPLPARRRLDAEPREPGDAVEYELEDWSVEQREGLDLRLRAGGVVFEWEGPLLRVAPDDEAEVDALVDEIDGGPADIVPVVAEPRSGPREEPFLTGDRPPLPLWNDQRPIASPGQRFWASFVESMLAGIATSVVRYQAGPWIAAIVAAAYVVAATALWGRTLGKALVHIQVIDERTGRPPSWGRSFVRWAVPVAPSLLVSPVSVPLAVIAFVWMVGVYAPIAFSRTCRGLHDRAAGTVVVTR